MKPVLTGDNKLSVELHKIDESQLGKARDVGKMLEAIHQGEGSSLVEAVDAILKKFSRPKANESNEAAKDGDE